MKALVCHGYDDSPGFLRIEEVPKPVPREDEVLVRIRAASLNAMDYHFMRMPRLLRLLTGPRRPRRTRCGVDLAGEVEAVGAKVTDFKVGDAVFGVSRGGTLAEYACAPQAKLAAKPESLSYEQAAALPAACITALQGLRDKGKLRPGQRVLINGAAGGVGSFAVQIGRWLGAEVTGVCSSRSVELVRSLGAARVVDYTREDFTQGAERYDFVFDLAGSRPLSACLRLLKPNGLYVGAGVTPGRWIAPLPRITQLFLWSRFSRRVAMFMARLTRQDLTTVGELAAEGKITPVLDRCHPLNEAPEAFRYLREQHARGKVVVTP